MIILIKINLLIISNSQNLTKLIISIIVGVVSYLIFILIFSKTFKQEFFALIENLKIKFMKKIYKENL